MATSKETSLKNGSGVLSAISRCLGRYSLLSLLCLGIMCYQIYLFIDSVSELWFNPLITTDDALQQSYEFHVIYHPGIFEGDFITETMKGYLAPLHYWVSYIITILTRDPIMTGHWVQLIQVVLTLAFIFAAVYSVVGFAPSCLAVTWFIHTRTLMQRMAGGLPRGWAPVIIAAFLYCILNKKHKTILFVLLCGCLSNPPATFICAFTYGLYLLILSFKKDTRTQGLKLLKRLLLLAPLYAIVTFAVVHRPESVGQMVDYKTAAAMPEFANPGGRFPFIPMPTISYDFTNFGIQPFYLARLHLDRPTFKIFGTTVHWNTTIKILIPFLLLIFCLYGAVKKRKVLPDALSCMLIAIVTTYLVSRPLAFNLYVPNRHLQFPLSIWLICTFCIVIWSAFVKVKKDMSCKNCLAASFFSVVIAVLCWIGVGNGLNGVANFNYPYYKKGRVFDWIKKYTPEKAVIAGHPTHIDGVMLFGIRRGFVTAEVSHPFYPKYYAEIDRRLRISLAAHFATSLEEFLNLLEPEGIDYFVFARKMFYPEELAKASYYKPLDILVKELTSKPVDEYVYKKLKASDLPSDITPFRDDESAVVDLKALKRYITKEQK